MTAVEVQGGPALPQERRLVTEIPGPVSRAWTARREAAVSSAVSVMMPVFAVAAGGGVVVDADGNSLIDFGSGIAVTTVGNAAPQVVAAVQEQVERFTHTCFMITPYAGYVEVAEALNALTPGDHDKRTALFNSGAEAVENAVKIARLATGRSAVAAFDHAYHGRTNLTMALTAKAMPYKLGFGPFAPEVYRAPLSYPFHDGLSGEAAAARAISVLDKQVGATQLAAVIVEPIQGEGGFIVPAPGFLPALAAWCREHGIVFIADEVQSGFARTGAMFACEHEGIVPDLVTTAKGIAGGLPLAGVTGRTEIMNAPHGGGVGGTFGGNPLACAAALAAMRTIEDDGLVERARAIESVALPRLRALAERDRRIGDVRGRGAMLAVELVDPSSGEPEAAVAKAVAAAAHARGLILLTCGTYGNVLRLLPPLSMPEHLLAEGLDVLEEAFGTASDACTNARSASRSRLAVLPRRESCLAVRESCDAVRLLEPRRVPRAVADDLRLVAREVDDRGRLRAAVAGVDHGVDGRVELLLDLPALGQRLVVARQQQRRRQQRLPQLGEDRLRHDVGRDAHPHGLLARVQQPPRHLPGGGEDERVAARRRRLHRAEHRLAHVHELAELGEVPADQREVVTVVELADRADPVDALTVADLAAQRVAGVGRVGHEAAAADEVDDLADRAPLRIHGMNVEVPRHGGQSRPP